MKKLYKYIQNIFQHIILLCYAFIYKRLQDQLETREQINKGKTNPNKINPKKLINFSDGEENKCKPKGKE